MSATLVDALHAVWRDDVIVAVFSNEGLAQTHLAKLGTLPKPADPTERPAYRVGPLLVDTETQADRYYSAYLQLDLGIFDYLREEVEVDLEDELAKVLPATSVSEYMTGHDSYMEYVAYGWTEAEARAKLDSVMAQHRKGGQAHE